MNNYILLLKKFYFLESFLSSIILILSAGIVSADVLLEQPPDYLNKHTSYKINGGSGTLVGDDYRPEQPVIVESVTFWMVANWPNIPYDWSFNVHRSTNLHWLYSFSPEYEFVYRMIGPSKVTDLGKWNDEEGLHLFEVTFDNVNLRLDPGPFDYNDDSFRVGGIYWFSTAGHIRDYPRDLSYMATSGNDEINGDEGWYKLEPQSGGDGWVPISRRGYGNRKPSDYAMRIEGRPANVNSSTEILDVRFITGDIVEGTLDNIRRSDQKFFHAKSGYRNEAGRHQAIEMVIHARTEVEDPDVIDITIESKMIHAGATAYIYLRNHRTDNQDIVAVYNVANTEITRPFRGIPGHDYVNNSGHIEILIQYFVDRRYLQYEFESVFDCINIDVREDN